MNSLKKNLFYNGLLYIIDFIFPFLTVPYACRVLGAYNIGVYSYSVTFSAYFITLAGFGLSVYGVRSIAKVSDDKKKLLIVLNQLMGINIVTSIVSFLLYVFITFVFAPKDIYGYLIIAGLPITLSFIKLDYYFAGIEKFSIITFRTAIVKIIIFILIFCLVRDQSDLLWYLLLYSLSYIIANVYNFLYLRQQRVKISPRFDCFKRHIPSMCIFLLTSLSIQLYLMIDNLMLAEISSFKEVGIYSAAIKPIRIISPVIATIGTVLLPRLSNMSESSMKCEINSLLSKSLDIIILSGSALSLYFFSVSKDFIFVFFGEEYLEGYIIMQILSWTILIGNISNFNYVQVLTVFQKEKLLLISVICGAVTNIFLNLLMIPHYGAIGAGVASLISEIVVLLFTSIFAKNATTFGYECGVNIKYIFIFLLFPLSVYAVHILNLTPLASLLSETIVSWIGVFSMLMCFREPHAVVIWDYLCQKVINRRR